jgi:hypothetical protein
MISGVLARNVALAYGISQKLQLEPALHGVDVVISGHS